MEIRGDYPNPVKQVTIGKSGIITLYTKETPRLNKEKYFSTFKNPRRDISAGIKTSYREYAVSFLPWLEITEPKFCVLSSSVGPGEIKYLPEPYKYRGKSIPMFYGISEKENVALINCLPKPPEGSAANLESEPETFNFYVSSYSKDDNLANHLLERIIEWDNAGRPDLNSLYVKAYFDKNKILPVKDEYKISKKWVDLFFSWR